MTLKLVMEISNVTGQANIGGIQQPIIGQRKIEHEIRLREGEVNLLGGIMENSDQVSINGWPFLAKIPIFRYLFSQENKQSSENEIVFALVPHIVRGQDLSELNNQSVDVGTATGIELRRSEQQAAPEVQQQSMNRPQPVSRSSCCCARRPFLHAAANPGCYCRPAAKWRASLWRTSAIGSAGYRQRSPGRCAAESELGR